MQVHHPLAFVYLSNFKILGSLNKLHKNVLAKNIKYGSTF